MRRALKISAWTVGGIALLILVLGGVLIVGGNSNAGRALIEKMTYRLTSGHVSLAGLTGSFPQALFIERLELSDDRGVWLTAERVTLDWSPAALLARRLQIDALHAAAVDMERLPESSPNAPSGTVSIPHIDVAGLAVDVVRLGAPLAGTPASLVLRGNAHLRSVRDMSIDATAHRIGGDGDYQVQLKFDPQRMDAAVTLHEPAGGPLENLLQLPGLGALAATLNLTGSRAAERLELSPSTPAPCGGVHRARSISTICRRTSILRSTRRPWRRGPIWAGSAPVCMGTGMAASRRRRRTGMSTSPNCGCPEVRVSPLSTAISRPIQARPRCT